MQTIRAWLKQNPAKAQAVLDSDQSFIFFKEQPLNDPMLGATGSEGVALTPMGSIAVDTRLHPLGAPFFVSAGHGVFVLRRRRVQRIGQAIGLGFALRAEPHARRDVQPVRLPVATDGPVDARSGILHVRVHAP